MGRVNVHNWWDPLEEIIVGSARGAQLPVIKDRSVWAILFSGGDDEYFQAAPSGQFPQQVIEETEEDLGELANQLVKLGIAVHRPEPIDLSQRVTTPYWEVDGFYVYCPRDSVLVVGDRVIETPMPLRHRFFENYAYRQLFLEYMREGARWLSAPKPQLLDELYEIGTARGNTLTELEPAFDAANVMCCGRDIFYLISDTGNHAGAHWLQTILGDEYRVHALDNVYANAHIDTTLVPLRPGLVLACPERVNSDNIPALLTQWEVMFAPDPVFVPALDDVAPASEWIGMNILSITPELIAVEERQLPLIRALEQKGFDIMPVRMRHCRTLAGGPHCVTLETRRRGVLEDYFEPL